MIEEQYIKQLQKQYNDYLRNIILEQPFEPILLFGGKKKPDTTRELHQRIQLFQQYEKVEGRNGWQIEWKESISKKLGRQQWPEKITVTTEADFLHLLQKQEEVAAFRMQLQVMLNWNNNIRGWLSAQPRRVLELQKKWKDISAVTDYLLANDVTGHYLRSLPVPVHTKFIDDNEAVILSLLKYLDPERFSTAFTKLDVALRLQQKPLIYSIRWLDPLLADKYSHGMEVMGVTPEGLRKLSWEIEAICMVENETNLHLLPQVKGMMAVWSRGKALSLLKEVPLLQQTKLFYWGDLDDEGFHMLNSFRQHYPHTQSLLMDQATVNFHFTEMKTQSLPYRKMQLPFLLTEEQTAYNTLSAVNGRIEQEQLQQEYIQQVLRAVVYHPPSVI
jgi:hypothetical protein